MLLLSVCIGICIFTIYCAENWHSAVSVRTCKNGLADLSTWNFKKDGEVKLNGYWEFYPQELLFSENFTSGKLLKKMFMAVPDGWTNNETKNSIPDRSYGTYRLEVKVNSTVDSYGIKIMNIRSSYKLFVNGKEVGSCGNPATSINSGYRTNVAPNVYFFPHKGNTLEIIIQVANLDYKDGGIIQDIFFGSQKAILADHIRSIIVETIPIAFLLLFGICCIIIYIIMPNSDPFVYLFIFCFTYAFISATGDEKILYAFVSSIPYFVLLKIKIAMVCLNIISVAFAVKYLNKEFVPFQVFKIIVFIMTAGIAAIIVVPTIYVSIVENANAVLYVLAYLLLAIWEASAISKKRYGRFGKKGTMFLLCVAIAVTFFLVDSLMYFSGMINSYAVQTFVIIFLVLWFLASFIGYYVNTYKKMESLNQELIQLDKMTDEFLLYTSQELKKPLHGIINLTQVVLEHKDAKIKEQKSNLSHIIATTKRLSSLVDDVIDFEKLKSDKLRLNQKIIDVSGLVQSVTEVLSYSKKGKDVRLINNITEGSYALADESRLRQILFRLVGNALMFTEKGTVELLCSEKDGCVYIRVEDTGVGMGESIKKNLFRDERTFENVDYPREAISPGVGLSMSKMLAENMGGDLYLERSEPNKGSVFVIRLAQPPRSQKVKLDITSDSCNIHARSGDLDAAAIAKARGSTKQTGKTKIMLVDDDPIDIRVMQQLFDRGRYETVLAYNGYQALELLSKNKDISVILLNVMMPGLSGYEVCKRIRLNYPLFEIPILLLTTGNTPEDIAMGLDLGANDFLVKPIDSKELTARVDTLIKMKEAVTEAIRMETAFLQSQIKPHFLYNALSVIASLCYSDAERGGELLAELSNYLRCSFDIDPHNSFVSLKKELSLVKSYVSLQKARFGDRLTVCYDIDEGALECRLPAYVLQPIVENSIRHGLMKKLSGGKVEISARLSSNELRIEVKDDGLGIPPEKLAALLEKCTAGGVGLKNVNRRLTNVYGQGLIISSIEGKGTEAIIVIPINAQ